MVFKKEFLQSTDYSKFSFIFGNRKVSMATTVRHLLVASINKFGIIHPIICAMVAGQIKIIDGQHRFTVCKANNQPIEYILYSMPDGSELSKALLEELIITTNNTSKAWTTLVMLAFKSSIAKDSDFEKFRVLKSECKSIDLTSLCHIVTGLHDKPKDLIYSENFKFKDSYSEEIVRAIDSATYTIMDSKENHDLVTGRKGDINMALYNIITYHAVTLQEIEIAILDDDELHTLNTTTRIGCEEDLLRRLKVIYE